MGTWGQWHIVHIGADVTDIVLSLVREVIALVRFVIFFTNFNRCIETDAYFAGLPLFARLGKGPFRMFVPSLT
jgi:hypothetical protein